MNFIERAMRVMAHINIGTTLGLAAWVLWSGCQVVTGQITPGFRVAEVKALMSLAHAGAPPPCHTAAPVPKQAALVLTETDL